MKVHNISEMKSGWFLGNFEPSLHKTEDFEIAYKKYKKFDEEPAHFHKLAVEFTLCIKGRVRFHFPQRDETILLYPDEICVVEPGEIVEFSAEIDSSTICIKIPGNGWKDKFLA